MWPGKRLADLGRKLRDRPGHRLYFLAGLAWLVIGVIGSTSYLSSYYQDRGFAPVARRPGVRAGRAQWVHFYSPALGREADYLVYLPSTYTPLQRYPVYYLLHGMPGRPQAYIRIGSIDARLDNLVAEGRMPPMILVFPDGRIGGDQYSDSEWANTPAGRYDDYVIDVVNDVDRRFLTVHNRDARVIAGLSAGAFGALNVALHHLPYFGSVQVWSGYFVETRSGVFAAAPRSDLVTNSPLEYVHTLRRALARDRLRVFIFGGRKDPNSRQIEPMARALRAAGATVRAAIYPGGHDWELWHARLDQMLILAGQDVTHPPPTLTTRRAAAHHLRHRRHRRRRGHHRRMPRR